MGRAIWSGAINFGLVSVPVRLHSAVSQKDIAFHQVEKSTGARIRYKRVSSRSGREVPYDKMAKGYELSKGKLVVIDPEELQSLDPKATHAVEIEDFVPLDQIDPIYYEHAYYLTPGRGGDKAYTLLLKAMKSSGRVAIGKVVIRTKQYLAAIRPLDGVLALETMLFGDEIVPADSLDGLPERSRVSEREMKMARQLIESLSTDFDPDRYRDDYRERVQQLIARKAKGRELVVEEQEEAGPAIADLMEALRASVEATPRRKAGPRTSNRKSGRRAPRVSHARSKRSVGAR